MWKLAIVDDDRQVIRGLSSQIPWQALQAECVGEGLDGEQGIELVRASNPDILITDIYMPEMNGIDMIRSLRKDGYAGKIIILSGYTDFEYAREALRLQVDDYLTKPISLTTLQNVLSKLVAALQEEAHKREEREKLESKLRLYEPPEAGEGPKGEWKKHKPTVDFMLQYIHEHYAKDITLAGLAEQVFISRNHLNEIFKKATGETFHFYLTKVRMEQAKRLILEGKWHIYEIANKVGYTNVPYFSTAFKKYFHGLNPTELSK
ncbi:response regulator [Paenibacillus filicis]|uniref:Response regulator n=1 Tax=Paenibacillus gyeongsangnamensis TaxID=3388067 RepID=A0ABT4Q5D7_9BACL|nr:response regulator [Paenibacillus filicis]MCZ8511900.1 response regulator [Paenibacillus filicis]